MRALFLTVAALVALPLLFVACDSSDDDPAPDPVVMTDPALVLANYADIVFASYEDSFDAAVALDQAIDAFIANPTQATFDAAKQAWLDSNEPYGQTEAYRFANGPIDDDDGPEGLLNAWPLDEGYIDYVVDPNDDSQVLRNGIVNDAMTYPTIDAQLLVDLNEVGSEKNISTGYHAIEFLLFGQDFNSATTGDTGGQRPFTDYTTEVDAERRKQYLGLVSDQLLANLQEMLDEWNPNGANNYRDTFLALDTDEALANVFTGIGTLAKSELAVERMFVAVENADQEDEHSCFSDNTDRDIVTNQQGVANVYRGTYTRTDGTVVSGPSFADLVEEADAAVAANVDASVTAALAAVAAIPDPFDQALINQSQVIIDAVQALQAQGDNFVAAAAALGVTINNELPD
ncbi:MAG: imelysin family protein [Bacteroidota bacterium]